MFRFIPFVFVCVLCACDNDVKTELDAPIADPKSNDWIFLQRIFPGGQIAPFAYAEVRAYQQEKLKSTLAQRDLPAWEFCGPTNIGGRITDVEILPSQPKTYFAGAASGGIFKSENSGTSWKPIFENELTLAIGDIALAPSDEDIMYVGTGEPNSGGGSIAYDGNGVYKSVDGGDSWTHLGLEQTGSVGKIIVHPTNPDIAYVGAMGHLFSKGPERGLYRTLDGGNSWEKVLFINDSTGIIDLAIHPNYPEVLYAAAWQRVREVNRINFGGPSSGIYRSPDGGNTWHKLTSGLPVTAGRIGIALSPSAPHILYAMYVHEITQEVKGIYRSDDHGESWLAKNVGFYDPPYMYWFGKIIADPVDSNTIYVTSLDLHKSKDGGISWSRVFRNAHVDHHSVAIQHDNPDHVLIGCDGGVYRSTTGGQYEIPLNTLPITQFYTCAINPSHPTHLYGGTQDNGTVRTTTGSTNDWNDIMWGDGFRVLIDPVQSQYIYAESQHGYLGRSVDGGYQFESAIEGIDRNDRFNWNTPVILHPSDPSVLFYGSHRLYKSTDRAVTWTPISEDLTLNIAHAGFTFGTITSIAASSVDDQIMYVGTNNGNVQLSMDGGYSWKLVSASLPKRWVTSVVTHPANWKIAYVTFSGYRFGEEVAHIFRTNDGGETWQDISGDLPDMPINDLIIIPSSRHLYIATDIGVFYSTDQGVQWELLGNGLPNVIVTDLSYLESENILVAATYGRGIYKINPEEEVTSISNIGTGTAGRLNIYPNPIREHATLEFETALSQFIGIEIVNLEGQQVDVLFRGKLAAGEHTFTMDIGSVPSGIYFCRVTCQDASYNAIQKIIKL